MAAQQGTGTVIRLVRDKGFGFLKEDNGTERFFHRSSAPEFDQFEETKSRVTFTPTDGGKGPRAESVRLA